MRNGVFVKQKHQSQADYVVDSLIAPNRLVLWASIPGEGKSLIGLSLGYHIAYDIDSFVGMKATTGNVMFIDSENRLDILQSRIKKVKKGLEMDGYKMAGEVEFQHFTGFLLDDRQTWQPIEDEVKATPYTLIVLDHLAMFHHQDENKENQMKKVTATIEDLMALSNASILVMHHFGKLDTGSFYKRLRGSSAIYAKTDTAYEVRALSHSDGKLERVGLIPQHRKDITPSAFRVKLEEGQDWLKLVHDGTYKPIDDPKMDELSHKFYHQFLEAENNNGITVKDMIQRIKGYATDTELRTTLRFLEHNKGLITSDKKGKGGGFHYRLPPSLHKTKECPWCKQRSLI